jgi:hypothetical protein
MTTRQARQRPTCTAVRAAGICASIRGSVPHSSILHWIFNQKRCIFGLEYDQKPIIFALEISHV